MLLRIGRVLRKHPRGWALVLGMVVLPPGIGWSLFHSLHRQATLEAPPPTLLLEDTRGRFLAEIDAREGQKGFWPVPKVLPQRVMAATLAAEDARFYEHGGVDWRAAGRALWQNLRYRRRVSGASTVAMQVARLQDPGPRTYRRKLAEAVVARGLIERYGHDAVLRHYLRVAPYGNQNHGIVYAARRYFNKPLEDLTWAESALLAGLPQLPGRMNLHRAQGRARAERRARHVLARLRALGVISESEWQEARDLLPTLQISTRETRPRCALHAALAMERLLKNRPLDPGRYMMRTTLDLDLQDAVQLKAWEAMQAYRPQGAGNIAVVVAEKTTGRILAYLGSEDYFDAQNAGAIDFARVPRSSGSTLKPFIYAQGLAQGAFSGGSLLMDVGMALQGPGGGYAIRNYDEAFLGPILYRHALANSRNIPAIQVQERLGTAAVYRNLCRLGLSRPDRDPSYYGAGLSIGGLYVTLHDLVQAYGVLANEGRASELHWFDEPAAPPRQLIPEDVARQITLFLSDPLARMPSFPRMGSLEYPFAVALKTGTSQGFRDAWCVAYSSRYLVGVWIGHPAHYPMHTTSGAGSAAEVVRSIMALLHPEEMQGLKEHPFPPPRGWEPRRICMLSGKLASEDCPSVVVEWFKPGTEPEPEQDVHRRVAVDARTGRLAAPDCPPAFIQTKAFTVLPPRFTAWARESGLELLPPELDEQALPELRTTSFKLTVTRPRAGTLKKDPEAPEAFQTLPLEASVSPPVPQVVWYVDGKPYKVADYPYSVRWKMVEGTHTFQVRLPFAPETSEPTRITIKP